MSHPTGGETKARDGAVAWDRCRNTKTARAHPLDSPPPLSPSYPFRGRIYNRALLPATMVESTAPSSERKAARGWREGEDILAAAVSESAIPVSSLYRHPPPERNSDRA